MPEKIEITLYTFDELSDEAKEKAIENYRAKNFEIFWSQEIFDSLKELLKLANVSLRDYSLGLERSYIKIDMEEEIKNLYGPRAIAWLENNLLCKLRVPWKGKRRIKGRKYKNYAGMIPSCPLTGICFDDDFLNELRENIKKNTLYDSFMWLADKYQSLLNAEHENQNSEEYISEHFSMNGYEFLETGEQA